jgi:hypothetical protein
MDLLTRISSPEFRENISSIVNDQAMRNSIECADYISRLNIRYNELIYKMIVDKLCQDIKQKNEIDNQQLTQNVALAILAKHHSSKKDTIKILNDIITSLNIFLKQC